MDIYAWQDGWNSSRYISEIETVVRFYAERETETILFFAQLVTPE